jgi:tRNA(fMet)-specific endonuclease VapC
MKRYLLDTGIMGHFINHRKGVDDRVREVRRGGAKIGTCLPVIAELFFGIELSESRGENLKRLRHALTRIVWWPLDEAAAQEYGRIAADLRRRGRTIQQIDMQVAAIALSLGNCTVVSTDRDLTEVSGLHVENWAN